MYRLKKPDFPDDLAEDCPSEENVAIAGRRYTVHNGRPHLCSCARVPGFSLSHARLWPRMWPHRSKVCGHMLGRDVRRKGWSHKSPALEGRPQSSMSNMAAHLLFLPPTYSHFYQVELPCWHCSRSADPLCCPSGASTAASGLPSKLFCST